MSDPVAPVVASPSFKALSDLIVLLCELANAIAVAPKPLSIASLSGLLPLLPQIETLGGEAGQIPAELEELDEEEAESLLGQVGSTLSLSNAKAEAVVVEVLKVAVDVVELLKAIKS